MKLTEQEQTLILIEGYTQKDIDKYIENCTVENYSMQRFKKYQTSQAKFRKLSDSLEDGVVYGEQQ